MDNESAIAIDCGINVVLVRNVVDANVILLRSASVGPAEVVVGARMLVARAIIAVDGTILLGGVVAVATELFVLRVVCVFVQGQMC